MTRGSKIKIYTSRNRFFLANSQKNKKRKTPKEAITSAVFNLFYYTGFVVLNLFLLAKKLVIYCFKTAAVILKKITNAPKFLKNDLAKTEVSLKKRFGLLFTRQFSRSLGLFLSIIILSITSVHSLNLIAKGFDLKNKILQTASIGNYYLDRAKNEIQNKDFSAADHSFAQAYQTFLKGNQELDQANQNFANLLGLLPQKNDAQQLLRAAGLVSQAGRSFIDLQKDLSSLKITATGFSCADRPTAQMFQNVSDELNSAQNALNQAQVLVNKINEKNIPASSRENFVQLKSQLEVLSFALNNFNQVFSLAQNLFMGDKNILVLFENNNELRAGGGFIGTYGNLKLLDGKITKLTVSSIYDLDGQMQETIKPPHPLLNVNGRWYLRDSNWFADFSQTALAASSFYEKEGGETPDAIIAVTPDVITGLLKITGPITLSKYNLTLTPDNFVEKTQVASTLSDNSPVNEPKQILADLVPLLLQKISEADTQAWPAILESVQNNLIQKQVVLYSRNSELQQQLADFHWDGSVAESDRDYLSVVSSNLGGTKTDLEMRQKYDLQTTINDDGSITEELTIERTNLLPANLEDGQNTSYIRILVPKGAKLQSATGFDYKNLDFPDNFNYQINQAAYDWEKSIMRDMVTGTDVGEESGKTFFGNWLTVKGGETRSVKLVYKLPFKLDSIDRYSLVVQKQIGSENENLSWHLNFSGRQIAWKNFDPQNLDTNNLNFAIILDKDMLLGAVLQKR